MVPSNLTHWITISNSTHVRREVEEKKMKYMTYLSHEGSKETANPSCLLQSCGH